MGYAQNMVMKLRAKDLLRKACIALCGEALQNLGNPANMERNIDGMQEEMYLGRFSRCKEKPVCVVNQCKLNLHTSPCAFEDLS